VSELKLPVRDENNLVKLKNSEILSKIKKYANKEINYYINYDGKDEKKLLDEFFCRNITVFLIETDIATIYSDRVRIYSANPDNISDLLDNICNEVSVEEYIIDSKKSNKYIFFKKIPYLSDNELIYDADDYLTKSIIKYLQFSHKYVGYIYYKNRIILNFINNKFDNNFHQVDYFNENNVLSFLGGIGDFFISFSYEYEFIKNRLNKNSRLYMPLVHQDRYKYLVELCYPNVFEYLVFNNKTYRNFWLKNINNNWIGDLDSIFTEENNDHILFSLKKIMNIKNIHPYKYNFILNKRIINNVRKEDKKYIDDLVSTNQNIIGLQFHTGFYDKSINKWKTDSIRSWDIENVKKFAELCSNNNIKVLILNPHDFGNIPGTLQLSQMSIEAYAYTISKLNIVVGIDSSAGHIASFYNLPSITIWGYHTPLRMAQNTTVGFRALRKNYSIIPKSENINDIKADKVYELAYDILNNKVSIEDKIISYNDSIKGDNILYVN